MQGSGQKDAGTSGYFLPEESQFRLKKLHTHMRFLSTLAQPRMFEEDEAGYGPEIGGDELAVCLELLAEQAERVLDEAAGSAVRVADGDRSRASRQGVAMGDSALDGEAVAAGAWDEPFAEPVVVDEDGDEDAADCELSAAGPRDAEAARADGVATTEGNETTFVCRMTMDQLDAVNRLHDRLAAYGDLIFGLERIDLADGTLTILGDVICEAARAARLLMDEVGGQALPAEPLDARHVLEPRAFYGLRAAPDDAVGAASSWLPPCAASGQSRQVATRH